MSAYEILEKSAFFCFFVSGFWQFLVNFKKSASH